MKYKLSDSTASGVGRSRTHPMTSTHPVGKLHKDDVSHKTRSNKINKNEGGVLRRSSRRATIERRVWAIPKKPAKLAPTNVKGKNAQKPGRKGKEKMTQGKVQVKNFNKSKSSQGTKRGLVTLEEAGNARRKVKKKEGIKDVGSNKDTGNEISVLTQNVNKKRVMLEPLENAVKEDVETDHKSQSTVMYQENKSSIDSSNVSGDMSKCVGVTDVRTGVPSVASADDCENIKLSTLHNENVDNDRVIEETLFTGEMCLNKAVIEEIVPDYEISDSQTADKNVNSVSGKKTSFIEGVNSSHVYRNIEDVLGHSYSKVKSLCSENCEDSNKQKCDCDSPEVVEKSEREVEEYILTDTSTDQQVIKTQLPCVGEEFSVTKTKHLLDIGEQELKDTCNPQLDVCSKDDFQKTNQNRKDEEHSDMKGRNINEIFLENSVVSRESIYSIRNTFMPEKDNCKLLENVTQKLCTQKEGTAVVPIENLDAEPHQDSEEEDHVSLSVALAQLVDSDNGGEAEGTETVTIHSASSVVQVEEEEGRGIVAVEVKPKDEVREKSGTHDDDAEDEEGELVIKEEDDDDDDDENDGETSEDDTEEDEAFSASDGKRDSKIQSCIALVNSEKSEICIDTDYERDTSCTDVPPSPPPKLKKQIPPLIKISSRPPAIKTPLKCPECPMQFCTVRSLLWHFGTHGARSRENCVPPILLQDLIVPWDKPTVSLFISQSPDNDKSAEKAISLAETVVPSSDAAVKMDTVGKQDLTMSAQIVRTEDYLGTNGDVILKVPIPRLKPKAQVTSCIKKDKFVNILPKMTTGDGQAASHSIQANPQPTILKPSNSPTPQITIHPQNNRSVDVVTVKPQHQIPKITIRADNPAQQVQIQPVVSSSQSAVQIQPLVSSQSSVQIQSLVSSSQSTVQIQPLASAHSAVQIQPLVSSSQSAVPIQPLVPSTTSTVQVQPVVTSTKATSTAPSHIALIPVDNLTAVGQNLNPRASKISHTPISMVAPSPLPAKASTAVDGILEKDGLVMINSNLALRIVSSLPSTLDTNTSTTNTTTIRPIASHLTNNLTILPQVDGSKLVNSKREGTKNPDILTIVPQVDLSKKLSLLKTATPIPSPQVASVPNSSGAPSQVVKLYLLQPKDPKNNDSAMKFGIAAESSNRVNGIEVPLPFSNRKEKVNSETMFSKNFKESESEDDDDDDEGMVIDDEKEGDDDMMDPLSLCAVTMEDENLDASNITSQPGQFNVNTAAGSNDKVTIKKVPVRAKGKSNQGVDIVKYEARKYVCCYCNRRFGWSTDLKRHVILHTGEKPFQCKVCPTAFTRKFLLQNHMKRMHLDKCKMSDLWP